MAALRAPLAPQSTLFAVLTAVVLVMPCVIPLGALYAPAPIAVMLWGTFAVTVLVYLSVWLWWRPTAFELSADALTITWPLRTRVVRRDQIVGAELVTMHDIRARYGLGFRFGAGGLFGAFGKLICRRGTLGMYISRTDDLVLIQLRAGNPLLISPRRAQRFVDALGA